MANEIKKQLEAELAALGYTFEQVEEGSAVSPDDWPMIGPVLAEHIGRLETYIAGLEEGIRRG